MSDTQLDQGLGMQKITAESKFQGILPFLAQRAIPRIGDTTIPGNYCPEQKVWIADGAPLVASATSLPEMSTKTDAVLERDDISPRMVFEMQTKTRAQMERDDQGHSLI